MEFEPQATKIVADLRAQAQNFRDHCMENIKRHEAATAFWKEEFGYVTDFLIMDQIEFMDQEVKAMPSSDREFTTRPTRSRDY